MHVACAMVFDGDAPAYEDLLEHIDSRLHLVPRYRQRLAEVPFGQGRPKWVDDDRFDLRYHVRHTALPSPGTEYELQVLAGRLFSQQMRRDRPLWENYLVEGLEGGRFAILSKTHHAMVDGISGLDILSVLFAPEEESADSAEWSPRPAPSRASLLAESLVERATTPFEIFRGARALVRGPRQVMSRLAESAVGAGAMAWAGLQPAPQSPYNAELVGPDRRFTWLRASLDDLKAIKNELGGSVNDVVLTIVARGLRRDLQRRGVDVDELKAFVPVSLRREDQRGSEELGNQVGGMIAPLPVGCDDAADCLRTISAAMSGLKESGQAVGAQALTELTGFAPPTIIHQAARLITRQRFINLVVTNVPGPQFPLHFAGREMLDIFPMVPLARNLTFGVAIVSYNGTMNFGLVGDFNAMEGLEEIPDDFAHALTEIADVAGVTITRERELALT